MREGASEPAAEASEPSQEGDGSGASQDAAESLRLGGLDPEAVHRARIEMAREALVEENVGKERVDLAEELQRELAALQATSQTSKSRVRHGAPRKKQP